MASYESTTATQTDNSNKFEEMPQFCPNWQFDGLFTAHGGTLKGANSDVRLEIPAKSTGNDSVLIKGAVYTDLNAAHEHLGLPQEERIVTPVVEYFAGKGFRFQQPVRVVLPHFMSPNASSDKVRAYVCQRSSSGSWSVTPLRLESKSNEDPKNGHKPETGVFYLAENNEIHVKTDHFSVYFCTECGTEFSTPNLTCKVFAKYTERETEDDESLVGIRLDIWDSRHKIKDFLHVSCFLN
jgi:hypothetical protein